jgi:hypothetical protein
MSDLRADLEHTCRQCGKGYVPTRLQEFHACPDCEVIVTCESCHVPYSVGNAINCKSDEPKRFCCNYCRDNPTYERPL